MVAAPSEPALFAGDSAIISAPFAVLRSTLEKKQDYIQKRLDRLSKLDAEVLEGKTLDPVQEEARSKRPEVEGQLEYIKYLHKVVKDQQKEYTKQARARELFLKEEVVRQSQAYAEFVVTSRDALRAFGTLCPKFSSSLTDAGLSEEDFDILVSVRDLLNRNDGDFEAYSEYFAEIGSAFLNVFRGTEVQVLPGVSGAAVKSLLELLKSLKLAPVEEATKAESNEAVEISTPVTEAVSGAVASESTVSNVTAASEVSDGPLPDEKALAKFCDKLCNTAETNSVSGQSCRNAALSTTVDLDSDKTSLCPDGVEEFVDSMEPSPTGVNEAGVENDSVTTATEVTDVSVSITNTATTTDDIISERKSLSEERLPGPPVVKTGGQVEKNGQSNGNGNYNQRRRGGAPFRGGRPRRPFDQNRKDHVQNGKDYQNGQARVGAGGSENNAPRPANTNRNGNFKRNDREFVQKPQYNKNGHNVPNRPTTRPAFNNYQTKPQSNGYSNAVPAGYVNEAGYLRPLPGRCGFTLALK